MSELKKKIEDALREVYDPEIPINVYDLGLIYEINIENNDTVNIVMTLTSPTCPTADYIESQVKEAIEIVEGVKSVNIKMTFNPPWSPDRVSTEAKEELGLTSSGAEDLSVKQVFENSISREEFENLLNRIEKIEKEIETLKKS